MAALPSYVFHLLHRNPFSLNFQPQMDAFEIFSFAFLIFCVALSLLLSLFFISLSVSKKLSKTEQQQQEEQTQNPKSHDSTIVKHSPLRGVGAVEVRNPNETNQTNLTLSLLLAVLPSDSAKRASLFNSKIYECDDPNSTSSSGGGREDSGEEQREKKKKKKRKAKKKKMNSIGEDSAELDKSEERADTSSNVRLRNESVCLYPFTSSSSAMQRKIKQQYDELVKCHESKKLTLAQVVKFTNSLVDARKELQHKADTIQRKFVITKALLYKADRSSFDRLRQQIYKLELEQKRLEEDAAVYNWLQQQLKLSPAYKKMLEIEVCMEKAKTCKLGENTEDEFADISFEEFLAQEKKDSFWQKNGKSRICSSS